MTLKWRPRRGAAQGYRGTRAAASGPDLLADPRDAAAFGAVIARDRASHGVTQQQVADALGVSPDEVAALEAGTGPAGQREIEEAVVRYARAVAKVRKSGPA